jgi:head-tail adaptor
MPQQLSAGDLRDRVAWQPPLRAENAAGQKVVTYDTLSTTWAKVEPVVGGGGEQDRHQQVTPTVSYTVTVRGRVVQRDGVPTVVPVGVRHDWRAVWVSRGVTLEVTAVVPHPNGGEFALVLCRERPASTAA